MAGNHYRQSMMIRKRRRGGRSVMFLFLLLLLPSCLLLDPVQANFFASPLRFRIFPGRTTTPKAHQHHDHDHHRNKHYLGVFITKWKRRIFGGDTVFTKPRRRKDENDNNELFNT